MKLSRYVNIGLFWCLILSSTLKAETAAQSFEAGYAKYMASNCAEAMDPLYKATLSENENRDRAHLYLAHCQSIYGRSADAAYNLDKIKAKSLKKPDQKLYKDLKTKHQEDIHTLNKIYFNATPYAGTGSNSPNSVKGTSTFYGLSLGLSRPTWSLGAFYESFAQDMTPATYKDYTQSMSGAQAGYFLLPVWRLSGSYTQVSGSNDQLKSVTVMGVQTDFYFLPLWSVFAEYYLSSYPTLLANSSLSYKYPVNANQYVVGLGFPIYNAASFGFNGSATYSGIQLTKSSDKAAVVDKNLSKDTSRYEVSLSSYVGKVNASVSYWGGEEVLGVRSRGSVLMNSTDRRKGGSKVGLGYTFNSYIGVNASYGMETYSANGTDGKLRDFNSSTMSGSLLLNW